MSEPLPTALLAPVTRLPHSTSRHRPRARGGASHAPRAFASDFGAPEPPSPLAVGKGRAWWSCPPSSCPGQGRASRVRHLNRHPNRLGRGRAPSSLAGGSCAGSAWTRQLLLVQGSGTQVSRGSLGDRDEQSPRQGAGHELRRPAWQWAAVARRGRAHSEMRVFSPRCSADSGRHCGIHPTSVSACRRPHTRPRARQLPG